jgi:hypothetical protein
MADGPSTQARLSFAGGDVYLGFGWRPPGICEGMMLGDPPTKKFLPQSATEFAAYSLMTGTTWLSFEKDGTMTIDGPEGTVVAHRE